MKSKIKKLPLNHNYNSAIFCKKENNKNVENKNSVNKENYSIIKKTIKCICCNINERNVCYKCHHLFCKIYEDEIGNY